MFSQFRSVVENIAPQARRGSQDNAAVDGPQEPPSPARSPDLHKSQQSLTLSSGQLADSALSSLRKSFASQRSGSPAPARTSNAPKSNLEERLRAKFAIGEASNATTPNISSRASPVPAPKQLSPDLIPLPGSPAMGPVSEPEGLPPLVLAPSLTLDQPDAASTAPDSSLEAATPSPPPPQVAAETDDMLSIALATELPKDTGMGGEISADEVPTELAQPEVPLRTNAESKAHIGASKEPASPVETRSDVVALQQQLRLVEQRFADVSTSFKRLQSEKDAFDAVVQDLTPLKSAADAEGLRRHLQGLTAKSEVSQDELQGVTDKLSRQGAQIEELRKGHREETTAQSSQINELRRQLGETEALFQVSQQSVATADEDAVKQRAEIDRLKVEMELLKGQAKEEEEKRVKAISLLKTVRQKLVKAEKEREDVQRELAAAQEKEKVERESNRAEKAKLQSESDARSIEHEKAVLGLKAQFEKELFSHRDRAEKEMTALRAQFELEAVTKQAAHSKEIAAKTSQISALENSVNNLSHDKSTFFEQLQLRQAELESSQSHLELLQGQVTELQYQLRESADRASLLNEELGEARRELDSRYQGPSTSAVDVARLLSATEDNYESRIAGLIKRLDAMEKERNEDALEWSQKLREKTREAEEIKRVLESSAKIQAQKEEATDLLREEISRLRELVSSHGSRLADSQLQSSKIQAIEIAAKAQVAELNAKIEALEKHIEESKSRESQLRAHNKTMREEIRKVQSSAALLERQRNPGVGYWTSRPESGSSDARIPSETPSSPKPPSPSPSSNEEEVNLEYLRNVILQFLEHKEMRPNLVRVLSIILHFTPQETRRLVAKV